MKTTGQWEEFSATLKFFRYFSLPSGMTSPLHAVLGILLTPKADCEGERGGQNPAAVVGALVLAPMIITT